MSVNDAAQFPVRWADTVNSGQLEQIVSLYHEDSLLIPTFSFEPLGITGIRDYFSQLLAKEQVGVELSLASLESIALSAEHYCLTGVYSFSFLVDKTVQQFPARFTFVINQNAEQPLLHHHSSQVPNLS